MTDNSQCPYIATKWIYSGYNVPYSIELSICDSREISSDKISYQLKKEEKTTNKNSVTKYFFVFSLINNNWNYYQ